jgi:hypothetical protein
MLLDPTPYRPRESNLPTGVFLSNPNPASPPLTLPPPLLGAIVPPLDIVSCWAGVYAVRSTVLFVLTQCATARTSRVESAMRVLVLRPGFARKIPSVREAWDLASFSQNILPFAILPYLDSAHMPRIAMA